MNVAAVCVVLGIAPLVFSGSAPVEEKPNVLVFILDDAGWKDAGYMDGDIATPNIDRIAAGGVRLNRFYAYSTCTPTRAAFFTGEAPSRSGIVYPIQHDDHYGCLLYTSDAADE